MTNQRILQIVREETAHQQGLLFEGMTYTPRRGYRNNELIEVHGPNGKQLINEGAIDSFQRVLDWAGFIPVIGDALDGVNALIYFLRKKFMEGIFSTIAIIPGVGSLISKPLKFIYKKVAKPIIDIFTTFAKNGKLAATKFFTLIKNSGSWIQQYAKPLIDGIKSKAGAIAKWISSINMKAFNKKILDYSYGWVAFPNWAITGIDGVLKQAKAFFTQMASPPPGLVHTTKRKIKGEVKDLTFGEKEEAKKQYNSGDVDKKKYPTLEEFIQSQIERKHKQATNKKVTKKKVGELKLWSKDTERVKKLQKILGIKVDGKFNDGTELAVKKWQKKNGLVQDGVVGPNTWAKMT